ncbi:hypothetical protein M8C21_012858 [Ambrosia artemisiifolia]|uniref:Uncharacterized protein n=1 Tax=Ambrosia artemisiifolia TaxID=4212 RepID=A0AAD5CW78_AMBAR|nr:hypothetical protein M8C21_012858 [Ambrosia artemisiifolia]
MWAFCVYLESTPVIPQVTMISFVLAWYDGEEGGEMEVTSFVEPLVGEVEASKAVALREADLQKELELMNALTQIEKPRC